MQSSMLIGMLLAGHLLLDLFLTLATLAVMSNLGFSTRYAIVLYSVVLGQGVFLAGWVVLAHQHPLLRLPTALWLGVLM